MIDPEELEKAIAHARDRQFAELFTLWLGLAAEQHPDILRAALAKVFDLSAIEEQHKRMSIVLADTQRMAGEAKALVIEVVDILDACERRTEILCQKLRKMEKV